MKKILLMGAIGLSVFSFGQNLNSDSITIYSTLDPIEMPHLNFDEDLCLVQNHQNIYDYRETLFFITNVKKCSNSYFLEGYLYGQKYFIKVSDRDKKLKITKDENLYTVEDIYNSIKTIQPIQYKKFVNYSQHISELMLIHKSDEAMQYMLEFRKKNTLGIFESHPVEQEIYTGAQFKILNLSKKTIKYITFNFYGINAVNDKVGTNKSLKGIGPVKELEEGKWTFDSVWLTDIIDKLKLTSINVLYMDGTLKNFSVPKDLWIDEDMYFQFTETMNLRQDLENK